MAAKAREKKKISAQTWLIWIILVILVALTIGGIKVYKLYRELFVENILLDGRKPIELHIGSDWNYDSVYTVLRDLGDSGIVKNLRILELTMKLKKYPDHVKPGRYVIERNMTNFDFVDMLRAGRQKPLRLTFNNIIYREDFCGQMAEQLELDSLELLEYLSSAEVQQQFGFNAYTIDCMFIPNTYEIYWNISVEGFVSRMQDEYQRFWNEERSRKAEEIGLNREEVIILASIVNAENTKHPEEWPRIAGVYMNRLNNSWPLQADPTMNFEMEVKPNYNLYEDIDKNSPYDTYHKQGLPPGPIRFPDIGAILAVLDYERHDYFFMVARPELDGYHEFNRTLEEHNRDKNLYKKSIKQQGIQRYNTE